jgi:hypothetical protein
MSSRMTLDDVHRLASSIAGDYPGIIVEGIAASDGEGESVELLLRVPRGDTPESHVVRARRLDEAMFERDLREQLNAELAKR